MKFNVVVISVLPVVASGQNMELTTTVRVSLPLSPRVL